MRIFITGATGFLGSYLVADLIGHGHQVGVLLRPGSDPWRIEEQLSLLTAITGDFDDIDSIRGPLTAFQPDAVAHLAWRGVGNADRNSPIQAHNIPDTLDLAALCIEAGARVFVGAGSQAEYGPYLRTIRESDVPNPTALYGRAKLAAGAMVGQLCAECGVRFAWLRIFSTYGPKDAPDWLIPSMIRTLKEGKRMSLTQCEQRWGFLHARDAASAFRLAITRGDAEGVFNLGSSEAPPLRKTVTALRDLVNPNANLGFGDIPYRPDQVMILQADISRLEALGWRPQIGLAQGLSETVTWYNAHQRN
jgi:UDP-glucose 4-epimerase